MYWGRRFDLPLIFLHLGAEVFDLCLHVGGVCVCHAIRSDVLSTLGGWVVQEPYYTLHLRWGKGFDLLITFYYTV